MERPPSSAITLPVAKAMAPVTSGTTAAPISCGVPQRAIGVRDSTADTKALGLFERGKEQFWKRTDLGFGTPFKTVTGGIFEPGFADVIQQMWAAYLMERAGLLNGRFGCATPDEAVATHEIFAAALQSQAQGTVVSL